VARLIAPVIQELLPMDFYKNKRKGFVAVSFEEDLVKIAHVVSEQGAFIVQGTRTIQDSELDDYLRTTKERDFIVVCTFQTFYQNVLSLPPAQDKYLRLLAEMEVKKDFAEVDQFSFFYDVLEEVQYEGKRVKETFVFAVDYREVHSMVERFGRFNKTIVALYSSVLTLSTLFPPADEREGEVLLSVLDTGQVKTLFLLKGGKPCFVRTTQSDQPGINDPDIDNINMTINYSRQTLRLSPARAVFVGTAVQRSGSVPSLVVPSASVQYPSSFIDSTESAADYAVPLSAILLHRDRPWGSLLPPAYQAMKTQRSLLVWSTALLLVLSLVAAGDIGLTVSEIPGLKSKIDKTRQEVTEKQALLKEYQGEKAQLQGVMPFITYMNKAYSSPDVLKALTALNFLPMEHIKIDSIQVDRKDSDLSFRFQGVILAHNFTDMDRYYRELIASFKAAKGFEVTTDSISVKDMVFSVEARWKM
jgi:hypothetical protein